MGIFVNSQDTGNIFEETGQPLEKHDKLESSCTIYGSFEKTYTHSLLYSKLGVCTRFYCSVNCSLFSKCNLRAV